MTSPTGKRRFATELPADVLARARATVVGLTRATGDQWTLAALTAEAITAWCDEMEATHNGGKPWPPVGQLRAGRPISGE